MVASNHEANRSNGSTSRRRRKVAIVGSGCAGIAAVWALKDTDCEVHLFERQPRLGGHTNTQTWRAKSGETTPVDTGFIVLNTATYPNFINFLKCVGVPTVRTEMTFSVCRNHGEFEWSGSGKGIFAQRRNLLSPRHWRMIFDIVRFNQYALDLLSRNDEEARTITIGEYLRREGYSKAFKDDYLIPMTAAVWSTSPDKASLEFPAQTLIRFLWNHHLLSTVAARPDWLTIPGGSQQYIDAVIQSFSAERLSVHRSTEVTHIERHSSQSKRAVKLHYRQDRSQSVVSPTDTTVKDMLSDDFDHVIMACHGDQVLPILTGDVHSTRKDSKRISTAELAASASLDQPSTDLSSNSSPDSRTSPSPAVSREEYDVFKSFATTENTCYLHSDLRLMPTRRDTWSSWNYLIQSSPSKEHHPAGVSLTYNMNILQLIPRNKFGHVLVTMNPDVPPDPSLTQGYFTYRHPLYTVEAVEAQRKLRSIQNTRGVSYCGAWTKYGFHEDGFSSGLEAAVQHLGAKLPFDFVDSTYSRGQKHEVMLPDHIIRLVINVILSAARLAAMLLRWAENVLTFPWALLILVPALFVGARIFAALEMVIVWPVGVLINIMQSKQDQKH